MEVETVIIGAVILGAILIIAALAAWFDDWKIMALACNFLILAVMLPRFFDTALCSACWSNKEVASYNEAVLLMLILTAILIARVKIGRP